MLHEGDSIIGANPAFVRMFGFEPDPARALDLSAIGLGQREREKPAGGLDDHDRPWEAELVRADGTRFAAEVAGRSLPYRGRTVRVTIIRDVTAYRDAIATEHQAADRLRALDELKNTFLNAVSHELRTPLSVVLGSALTLERLGFDLSQEDQRSLLHAVTENARKLERMLTDLLDVDRLTRGVLQIQRQQADLGEMVRRIVDSMDLHGRRVDVVAGPFPFMVDGPKIERVVENLLSNAIRYTPADCPIWVRVERRDGGASIVVEDAGPGIPAASRAAIFEPFRQGENVRDDSPGVGIGLSLVARFAELHGGHAWVEERPGGGSAFHVFITDHGGLDEASGRAAADPRDDAHAAAV